MFVQFFHHLKSAGLPVSLREYLTLMEAMAADVPERSVDHFYTAIKNTRIQMAEIIKISQPFGEGALAGSRWSINGNDYRRLIGHLGRGFSPISGSGERESFHAAIKTTPPAPIEQGGCAFGFTFGLIHR